MSNSTEARDQFLEKALALDPISEGAQLLELRREYQSGDSNQRVARTRTSGQSRERSPALDRERAEQILKEVHDSFWASSGGDVGARLLALDLESMPDLQRYRNRLLRVDELRDDFLEFEQDSNSDRNFTRALEEILIAAEKGAVELRARFVRSGSHAGVLRRNKRSIKALKNYPELYELEEAWFKRIQDAKKDSKDSRALRTQLGLGIFAVWFVAKMILRLIRMDSGE